MDGILSCIAVLVFVVNGCSFHARLSLSMANSNGVRIHTPSSDKDLRVRYTAAGLLCLDFYCDAR